MKFIQHYSSSRSNLYEVISGGGQRPRRLLLECGTRWEKVQKAMHYHLLTIDGCLLTHEHQDHCKAVRDVMKAGINVYSSPGTFEALGLKGNRRTTPVQEYSAFQVGIAFTVMAFPIRHDAADPYGYIIHEINSDEYLFFAPDSGFIEQDFKAVHKGETEPRRIQFTIIAIECSYDKAILDKRVKDKTINDIFAKRLLKAHAERRTTLNYLRKCCDLTKCREIHLLHCSGENLDKRAAVREFKQKLFAETYIL